MINFLKFLQLITKMNMGVLKIFSYVKKHITFTISTRQASTMKLYFRWSLLMTLVAVIVDRRMTHSSWLFFLNQNSLCEITLVSYKTLNTSICILLMSWLYKNCKI